MFKMTPSRFATFTLSACALIGAAISCDLLEVTDQKPTEIVKSLPSFPQSKEEMIQRTDTALQHAKDSLDAIAALNDDDLKRETVLKALDKVFYELQRDTDPITFLAYVSKDKELRETGFAMEEKVSKFYVEYSTRKDIYEQLKKYSEKKPRLSRSEQKFLEDNIRDFENDGINLPEDKRAELRTLKDKLAELESEYSKQKNASGKDAVIILEASEMGNLSEAGKKAVAELKTPDGKYKVRLAVTGDVIPVYDYVPVEATRKKVYLARRNFAREATSGLMAKILQNRIKAAKVLGEKSWANIKLKSKMAKTPEKALAFLKEVSESIRPKFNEEIAELLALKLEELGQVESEGNKEIKIEQWDTSYYGRINTERKLNFDPNEVKPYFEYYNTLKAMIAHYELVFGIKINFVDDIPYKWDEKVQLIEFTDAKSSQHLGYLYLDMFPRPEHEKYSHFAHFGLRTNFQGVDGKQTRPVSSLVCNFDEPKEGKPSLLTLDNVETLFHEFGHAVHAALTTAQLASQAGTSVARDFVEAPSQFLEFFVTDDKTISKFAKHYLTGEKMPEALLQKIKDSKLNGVATGYGFQMALAYADMRVHSEIQDENVDSETIEQVLRDSFSEFYLGVSDPLYMMSSFAHIWGGYDASYYGYAWADVIAADLASVFEESPDGFSDTELGAKYRKEILEPGSSRDENESIEAFLGRESNSEAFKRKLGVK